MDKEVKFGVATKSEKYRLIRDLSRLGWWSQRKAISKLIAKFKKEYI